MNQTPQDIIKERYARSGNIARFADLSVSPVDHELDPWPDFLDWHGQPEVIGVNSTSDDDSVGNLAGVLIDPETAVLIDLVDEKIVAMDTSFNIAFVYDLERTRDSKRDAEIMLLYQRLINELLRQHTRAAG